MLTRKRLTAQAVKSMSNNNLGSRAWILNPHINKGTAYTIEERMKLGIHGLLPPSVVDIDTQIARLVKNYSYETTDLGRYSFLMALYERNETLFYKMVQSDVKKYMPIIYTPTVGLACQKFGEIFKRPRGLYITIRDRGNIASILQNWHEKEVKAIVVTDGERILGLGDLGCQGMGISIGKLALYTACAGVKPDMTLPIQIDVGTNNETLLKDPFYPGLRQKRVQGKEYEEFLDEFMSAVSHEFGKQTLVQFEDFGNHNAFKLLRKYKNKYLTFNDDIQGTAACATAGILATQRITAQPVTDQKFLFLGAGEAGLGVANLLVLLLRDMGVNPADAYKKIWLYDIDGLITSGRSDLDPMHLKFAHDHADVTSFEDAVDKLKPTAIIGLAGAGRKFTPKILKKMADYNERPIIFALSNPTSRAECTAEEAYTNTDGRCVFACGSPMKSVTYKGQNFVPGQGNNVYIFPGVALACILTGATTINDRAFLIAAQRVAQELSEEEIQSGAVYPDLNRIREISEKVAVDVSKYLFDAELATYRPEPHDHAAWVASKTWHPEYKKILRPEYHEKFDTNWKYHLDRLGSQNTKTS